MFNGQCCVQRGNVKKWRDHGGDHRNLCLSQKKANREKMEWKKDRWYVTEQGQTRNEKESTQH
jgi:hypothetical protein